MSHYQKYFIDFCLLKKEPCLHPPHDSAQNISGGVYMTHKENLAPPTL